VREVCRRAGANIAAVSYHFGGKEELYAEVLRRNFRLALERFPADGGVPPTAPPEDRLRGFIRSFLQRIFVTGPDACHGRILAREMVEPTPALDALVDHEVRGLVAHLESILREILGPQVPAEAGLFCLASVVSQIVFYQHCRPVISRLFPGITAEGPDLQRLEDHIVSFSLAGLNHARARKAGADQAQPARRPSRGPQRARISNPSPQPA